MKNLLIIFYFQVIFIQLIITPLLADSLTVLDFSLKNSIEQDSVGKYEYNNSTVLTFTVNNELKGKNGQCLAILYQGSKQGSSGIYIDLGSINKRGINSSEYDYLSFWVKGEKGVDKVGLMLNNSKFNKIKKSIVNQSAENFLQKTVTNVWQEVIIPLNYFGVTGKIKTLIFGFEPSEEGVIYLDNINFKKDLSRTVFAKSKIIKQSDKSFKLPSKGSAVVSESTASITSIKGKAKKVADFAINKNDRNKSGSLQEKLTDKKALSKRDTQLSQYIGDEEIAELEEFVVEEQITEVSELQYVPITFLTEEDLKLLTKSTLGETLSWQPGVSSTYYGPTTSRPVIRGFDGNRVLVLENGINTGDLSNVSPDHGVSVEPLLIDSLEIVRNSSTLLYGGGAIGGAVNVKSKNIPKRKLEEDYQPVNLEFRYNSAVDERTTVLMVSESVGDFVINLNGVSRNTGNFKIPDRASTGKISQLDVALGNANATTTFISEIPNTDSDSVIGSAGIAYFWDKGRAGLSVNGYNSNYGVVPFPRGIFDNPTVLSESELDIVRVDQKHRRIDVELDLDTPFESIDKIQFRGRYSDYDYSETVNKLPESFFENDGFDSRLEIFHKPFFGFSGVAGIQFQQYLLEVNGIGRFNFMGNQFAINFPFTPPTETTNYALFFLESRKLGPFEFQIGGRFEKQKHDRLQEKDTFEETAKSGSMTLSYNLNNKFVFSANLAHSERPPTSIEQFAFYPHEAIGVFEKGKYSATVNPNVPGSGQLLNIERSNGLDLGIKKITGSLTGLISAFYYKFDNFIFLENQGNVERLFNIELPAFQYVERDAEFYGAEFEAKYEFISQDNLKMNISLLADVVRGNDLTLNLPIPRVPPVRYGSRLEFQPKNMNLGFEVRFVEDQNKITPSENSTDEYAFFNADFKFTQTIKNIDFNILLKGSNLTDADGRVHASFLKEYTPLPGRSFSLGVNMQF